MRIYRKNGFTLTELVITIAIIAILAAIAVPNLLRSRQSANEATALTSLRAYASAQVTFRDAKLGSNTRNTKAGGAGFCDNFRNLYYGNPRKATNRTIDLISRTFADAYARVPGAAFATTNGVPVPPTPQPNLYHGYLFAEPKEFVAATGNPFKTGFALLSVPGLTGNEGPGVFFIGIEGTIWVTIPNAGQDYAITIEMDTPANPGVTPGIWSGV